jgi:N-alpha-acetyltransferase 35, NatC auxiliary subunit
MSLESIVDTVGLSLVWLNRATIPKNLKDALRCRVELRLHLLEMFESNTPLEVEGMPELAQGLLMLEMIGRTRGLGRPTSTASFTIKIQRRLASSAPPRPMIVVDPDTALGFSRQLMKDTTSAFQVLDITSSQDLLTAYQYLMAQDPQPAVYTRALLQSFLNHEEQVICRFSNESFILSDIENLTLPQEMGFDERLTQDVSHEDQDEFASRFRRVSLDYAQSLVNLFRTVCMNRCRMRRTMCHAALEWDQIQIEAEELDAMAGTILKEMPVPYPTGGEPAFSYSFSSWVYHHKLVQLRTILQSGFELSIYAPYEYASMYWYLSYLTGVHMNHLERISHFVSCRPQADFATEQKVQKTLKRLFRIFTWLKGSEGLAQALHRIFVVLQRHGYVQKPRNTYASGALRYELRMRPFLHMSVPEPISFEQAQELSMLREYSDQQLLDQAATRVNVAKKAWQEVLKTGWNFDPVENEYNKIIDLKESVVEKCWTQDVKNTMRTCIGAGLVVMTLSKALQNEQGALNASKVEVPEVGDRDRWHVNWPVPKVVL